MSEEGWIKVYRKLLDSPVFNKAEILKVFIWGLLKATHKEHRQVLGCQEVTLRPGQFIFGRKVAAKELKMKESTVRNYIDFLTGRQNYVNRHKDRELDIHPFSKFSIVTVRKWNEYQKPRQESGQHQDTNNNDKNYIGVKYMDKKEKQILDDLGKFKKMHELDTEEFI